MWKGVNVTAAHDEVKFSDEMIAQVKTACETSHVASCRNRLFCDTKGKFKRGNISEEKFCANVKHLKESEAKKAKHRTKDQDAVTAKKTVDSILDLIWQMNPELSIKAF